MKHRTTLDLYDYWQRLRGTRPAPDRSDIEPADIRTLLADTFILEVVSRTEYRFRLAGTRICALYGREMKGKDFLSFWKGKDRDAVASLLAAIHEDAAAAVIGVSGRSAHDRNIDLECLLLPVSQPGQGHSRVLGSLVPMADPYWIGIHPVMHQTIASLRLIWPDERPFQIGKPNVSVIPDLPQGGQAVIRSFRRKVAHLVVYDGGKASGRELDG